MAVPTGKLAFAYKTIAALEQQLADVRAQLPSQGGEAVAMRQRFSHIEDEIMAGKHTASSVFTQMRTAALYTRPADQVAEPDAELIELLRDAREFAAAYVSNSFFGANARKTLSRIDAKMASLKGAP